MDLGQTFDVVDTLSPDFCDFISLDESDWDCDEFFKFLDENLRNCKDNDFYVINQEVFLKLQSKDPPQHNLIVFATFSEFYEMMKKLAQLYPESLNRLLEKYDPSLSKFIKICKKLPPHRLESFILDLKGKDLASSKIFGDFCESILNK